MLLASSAADLDFSCAAYGIRAVRGDYALARNLSWTRREFARRGTLMAQADLLEAQRTLYGSQQALVRSKLVRLSNLINLYKALGGGWTEFAAPPDDPLTR